MVMEARKWPSGPLAILLRPVSRAYGAVASRRFHRAKAERVQAPVICVGNPTVGGAGKTPTAIAIAEVAARLGRQPGFVSRGYGGSLSGREAIIVDAERHSAAEVGDEPLLLARTARTVICADRVKAARRAIAEGCDLLIVDDGFQSRAIHFDMAILVVDQTAGLGNGCILPNGPLRMPLDEQLTAADVLLAIDSGGENRVSELLRQAARAGCRIVRARSGVAESERWRHERLFAFCGIGDPPKFFRALERVGADVVGTQSFPDHYAYRKTDIEAMSRLAQEVDAKLVTTAKDAVRLRAVGHETEIEVAHLAIEFAGGALEALVERTIERYKRRR